MNKEELDELAEGLRQFKHDLTLVPTAVACISDMMIFLVDDAFKAAGEDPDADAMVKLDRAWFQPFLDKYKIALDDDQVHRLGNKILSNAREHLLRGADGISVCDLFDLAHGMFHAMQDKPSVMH